MIILLTKSSSFQNYFANYLFERKNLDYIFVESGESVSSQSKTLKKVRSVLSTIPLNNPKKAFHRIKYLINKNKYYGNQFEHDKSLLKTSFEALSPELPAQFVRNLNDIASIEAIKTKAPSLIVVFGTGLLKKEFISSFDCPIINLHWGLSPRYRGEGIVTALALGGKDEIGFTLHWIDEGIDSGKILLKRTVKILNSDNFYSIGLRITVAATESVNQLISQFKMGGELPSGEKQDLTLGKNYSSKYMINHPELFQKAWKAINL